jgi:simple sugar transport system ATP-binding protein
VPGSIDSASRPLLEANGLVVDFPGVRALDHVDFDCRAGEIHALMGENGAGKSTLIRVLTGLCRPDVGSIGVLGRPVRPRSPRDAERAGISAVYQEVDLIPTLSVAENICLGRQPTRLALIRRGAVRRRAEAALERLGLRLDVNRLLRDYPIGIQQMVAISRALDIEARVLILDEPTSSLDACETRALFDVMRRLRAEGLGLVFVSHFLSQVYEISDRVTVLRNGTKVGTWRATDLPREGLVEAMTGRKISLCAATRGASVSAAEATLEFTGLRSSAVGPASGRVGKGEALGFAGLLGSGRTELARLVFGADHPDAGRVECAGVRVHSGSVRDAVAHGLAFTPEDRKAQGLIAHLSVRENIVLALQARHGVRRISPAEQARLADHYIRALNIRTPGPDTPVRLLSGGNQQKVLLARWLATSPKVLILDEPTRGIDVGARAEIESLIDGLRRQGLAVILISSELDEIVRMCGRVLVLRDRRPAGEVVGAEVSEGRILSLIAGAAAAGAA